MGLRTSYHAATDAGDLVEARSAARLDLGLAALLAQSGLLGRSLGGGVAR